MSWEKKTIFWQSYWVYVYPCLPKFLFYHQLFVYRKFQRFLKESMNSRNVLQSVSVNKKWRISWTYALLSTPCLFHGVLSWHQPKEKELASWDSQYAYPKAEKGLLLTRLLMHVCRTKRFNICYNPRIVLRLRKCWLMK